MAHGPFVAILDASLRLPERASFEDEADVRRRIALTLPPGVPDYVAAVIRVERHAGDRLMADLLVFDAQTMTVEIRGDAADGDFMMMRWHAQDDDVPFGWDPKARSWRRMPGMDPDEGPDPVARWDAHQADLVAKAERQRLGRIRAAETRRLNRERAAAEETGAPPPPCDPQGFNDSIW